MKNILVLVTKTSNSFTLQGWNKQHIIESPLNMCYKVSLHNLLHTQSLMAMPALINMEYGHVRHGIQPQTLHNLATWDLIFKRNLLLVPRFIINNDLVSLFWKSHYLIPSFYFHHTFKSFRPFRWQYFNINHYALPKYCNYL